MRCEAIAHLVSKVVQFKESGPTLNLSLNESGWSHLHIATTEVVISEAKEIVIRSGSIHGHTQLTTESQLNVLERFSTAAKLFVDVTLT